MSITILTKAGFEGIKTKSFTPLYNLGSFNVEYLVIAGGGSGGDVEIITMPVEVEVQEDIEIPMHQKLQEVVPLLKPQ